MFAKGVLSLSNCKCCKGCDERKVNCHAWCEEYQEWFKKHEIEKAQIAEMRIKESIGSGRRLNKTRYLQERKRKLMR